MTEKVQIKDVWPELMTFYTQETFDALRHRDKAYVLSEGVKAGRITMNQARQVVGLEPIEGGDDYFQEAE